MGEPRLIDASKLNMLSWGSANDAAFDINNALTIDAVPVVRCKDCKHCEDRRNYLRCVRFGFTKGHEVKSEGFCSYGEKKDGEG